MGVAPADCSVSKPLLLPKIINRWPWRIFVQRSAARWDGNILNFEHLLISMKCSRYRTDIVCVSTYPPSHKTVTLEALKMPLKAILGDQRLGHSVASGRRILDAVKQRNIPMATPHGLMVKRCPLEIIERTQNGEIGELKLIEIQSPEWDIIDAGIHWLDFAVNLNAGSDVRSVITACDKTTRTFRDGMQDVETTAVTYVQLFNGFGIVMQTGDWIRSNGRRDGVTFRMIGDSGQIEFWGWQPDYYLMNANHSMGILITPAGQATSLHRRRISKICFR